jgi:UDP-3-O-[3-hydroxymyristoyl] glucosamine N-acyltransferase
LASKVPSEYGVLLAENPRDSFYEIHEKMLKISYLNKKIGVIGVNCPIHPTAIVSPQATLGDRVLAGEFAIVRENVLIEDDVYLEAGVTIGINGILYRHVNNALKLIPHGGIVHIEQGASLLANASVVRVFSLVQKL